MIRLYISSIHRIFPSSPYPIFFHKKIREVLKDLKTKINLNICIFLLLRGNIPALRDEEPQCCSQEHLDRRLCELPPNLNHYLNIIPGLSLNQDPTLTYTLLIFPS